MEAIKLKAAEFIDARRPRAEEIAREIWGYAETAFEEHKSSKLLADALEEEGFEVQRGVGDLPTAFIARWGEGGPAVGLLAEYDALPNCGETPDQNGHGCGHNLLGTGTIFAAVAAARALREANRPGRIVCYGCPAEETVEGKVYMARDGAFEGLDAVMAWHPLDQSRALGGSSNALESMIFEFFGKTAHAAFDPWEGRSALDAVEIMNYGVNMLREHMTEDARIHYVIKSGGSAPNVVPSYAKVWYFVRAAKRAQVKPLVERVVNCAKAGALAAGTEMKMTRVTAVYEALTNQGVVQCLQRNLEAVGAHRFNEEEKKFARDLGFDAPLSEEVSPLDPEDIRASNDLGDVSWLAPFGWLYITCHAPGTPVHSWRAAQQYGNTLGEKGMIVGAKSLATAALELILDPEALKKVRAEFEEKTRGFTYEPPLPKGRKPDLELTR